MTKRLPHALIALLLLAAFLPVHIVRADTGPKPSMTFNFKQQADAPQVTITSGTLFECDASDCSDAQPLKQLGPQGFSCQADTCSAMAYGFSDYHKLSIQFSDGVTRESNIFKTAQFDSVYEVIINPSDLQVNAISHISPPRFSWPLVAILLCVIGGLGLLVIIIVVIVLLVRRSRKK